MVLRGLSSRLEAGKLQIGTLRADDSHRVKPRCVPGDFLSWFVSTKVLTPVLTCRVSVRNCKINIEGADIWKSHHSAVKLAVGEEPKSPSSLNFTGSLPTDKIQGLWDPKRTSIQQKMSWMLLHLHEPCHSVRFGLKDQAFYEAEVVSCQAT